VEGAYQLAISCSRQQADMEIGANDTFGDGVRELFRDLRRLKQASSNAAGSVNRPISLKDSKNCRSKRLAIAWMKRIAEPGSKRKNVGTSESELGVSSTEGQADRPSRLAAG